MPSTRDFSSLGVYAKDAEASFPGQPRVAGTAYRNVEVSNIQQVGGKTYNVTPESENFNQQLYNMSSFTDLIDRTGILFWKDNITYDKGAVVLASDGLLYSALQDGLNNVDPLDEINPEAPTFWRELKGSEVLALDLSSQTPGDEGAERVGTFNTFKSPGGRTLQKSLDENAESLYKMNNMNIKAHGNFSVTVNSTLAFNAFNIDTMAAVPNNIQVNGQDVLGYMQLNFTSPVPVDSIVKLSITPFNQLLTNTPAGGQLQIVKHSSSASYTELTANDIKIGSLSISQIQKFATHPTWPDFEDLECRVLWDVRLMIYTIEP